MKFKKNLILSFVFAFGVTCVAQAIDNQSISVPLNSTPPLAASIPFTIPPAPNFDVHGFILMDAATGQILASKNAELRTAPASLTKLMVLYLTSSGLKNKQISLDTLVPISQLAWKTGGSRMFVKPGTQVPLHDLIQGVIVDSGNDATMALAEFLAGSTDSFVSLMNSQAQRLGMLNTHYQDPTGLPADNHYSSPHDMAILARALIQDFPEYYDWYKQKSFTYNKITQANRNHLLWRDPSVDGLKTGFTDAAGYCLVSSALRDGTRLISVIMGAPTNSDRYSFSQSLLNYGFRFYKTTHIYNSGSVVTMVRSWYGKNAMLSVGTDRDLSITLPANKVPTIKSVVHLDKLVESPVQKGQIIGKISVFVDGQLFATQSLVALDNNPVGNIFTRMADSVRLTLHKIF
jgi:serine-type D-Ala-D-Ala carboxypeptidase (penicillin-binding protein 5/6)